MALKLSHAQLDILTYVEKNPGVSERDISRHSQIDNKAALHNTLNELVSFGLLGLREEMLYTVTTLCSVILGKVTPNPILAERLKKNNWEYPVTHEVIARQVADERQALLDNIKPKTALTTPAANVSTVEKQNKQAEQARIKAEQEEQAKQARIKAEQAEQAEQARIKAKQARIKAEQEEQAEQARIKAEQEKQAKQARIKAEQEEQAKQARIKAEQEEQAEQARIKAEQEEQAKQERVKVKKKEPVVNFIPEELTPSSDTVDDKQEERFDMKATDDIQISADLALNKKEKRILSLMLTNYSEYQSKSTGPEAQILLARGIIASKDGKHSLHKDMVKTEQDGQKLILKSAVPTISYAGLSRNQRLIFDAAYSTKSYYLSPGKLSTLLSLNEELGEKTDDPASVVDSLIKMGLLEYRSNNMYYLTLAARSIFEHTAMRSPALSAIKNDSALLDLLNKVLPYSETLMQKLGRSVTANKAGKDHDTKDQPEEAKTTSPDQASSETNEAKPTLAADVSITDDVQDIKTQEAEVLSTDIPDNTSLDALAEHKEAQVDEQDTTDLSDPIRTRDKVTLADVEFHHSLSALQLQLEQLSGKTPENTGKKLALINVLLNSGIASNVEIRSILQDMELDYRRWINWENDK